jgi:polyisoprenoid-binding protein YceI
MSRFVKLAPAFAALTFAFTAAADGDVPKVKDKPTVEFNAKGTGGLKINGTGSNLKIFEDKGKVVFKVSLLDLKTGIGLRDTHTQKYLETSKWPDASFSIPKDKLKAKDGGEKSVTGDLRIHGVSKSRTLKYKMKRDGDTYEVESNFEVNILDHDIEKPCYLGVCMDEKVQVHVKFKAKD